MAEEPPRRILLVEGADDEHVVRHLCARQQDMPSFHIDNKGGFPQLKDSIGPEIKVAGRTHLGILVDANDNFNARWQSVANHLRQADVNPPTHTAQTGTVVAGQPRVGIWLMPNNGSPGELEDFIRQLIPAGDPVWPRAQRYIDGIPEADRRFATGKVLRAKIHAWLATRAEPRKMGGAIGVGDLNAMDPLARQFIDWLRWVFG